LIILHIGLIYLQEYGDKDGEKCVNSNDGDDHDDDDDDNNNNKYNNNNNNNSSPKVPFHPASHSTGTGFLSLE
jgi:hypothetical protein